MRKKDGSLRLCIDYRDLNAVTVKDAYPMPRMDDVLDSLSGSKIFSKLDALSGYHQVGVAEADIPKTAFACRIGAFEFVRMPFGLVNAPATFQRIMDDVLREFNWKFVAVYLDDIIVHSRSLEEHRMHLDLVRKSWGK